MHRQRARFLRLLDRGDAGLHRLLHLLEGAHSIWRMRSRETPNSLAKSSSVIGSSASRRASKMRRSRSLSTSSVPVFPCPPGKLFATSQTVLWNLGAGLSNLSAFPAGRVAEMGRA